MKVASWKQRVIAFLIDYSIIFLVWFGVGQLFVDDTFQSAFLYAWNHLITFTLGMEELVYFASELSSMTTLIYFIVIMAIYCLYFCVLPIIYEKQTLGRLVAKVRIVKLNGEKMSFGTLFFREFMGKIFLGIMTFGIIWIVSFLMTVFATVKRTIHDRMANTLMVPINLVNDNHYVVEGN